MKIKPPPHLAAILTLMFTFLAACQSADENPAPKLAGPSTALAQPAPLGAYLWALVELNGDKTPDIQNPLGAHLIFLEDEGRIAGSTGCNRLMGGYATTPDGGFTLGDVATTKMACPNMEGETAFLKALRDFDRAVIGASRIRLLDDSSEVIAIFEARAMPKEN